MGLVVLNFAVVDIIWVRMKLASINAGHQANDKVVSRQRYPPLKFMLEAELWQCFESTSQADDYLDNVH